MIRLDGWARRLRAGRPTRESSGGSRSEAAPTFACALLLDIAAITGGGLAVYGVQTSHGALDDLTARINDQPQPSVPMVEGHPIASGIFIDSPFADRREPADTHFLEHSGAIETEVGGDQRGLEIDASVRQGD